MRQQRSKKHQHKTNPAQWWIIGVGLLAVLIIGAILLTRDNSTAEGSLPNEVSVAEAKSMQSKGAFILDVREPDEWAQGHIPGAELIPLGQLESRLAELPKDQEIVVVCRSGNRSATGRDILLENGFTSVTSMAGGMNNWQANGFSVE